MSTSRGDRLQVKGILNWFVLGIILLVCNLGSMGILLAAGTCGAPTFSPAVNLNVSTLPSAVLVADFNGDGKADLAIAEKGANTLSILLGNGDGTFAAPLIALTGGDTPLGLAVGDFNEDGHLDLAVANGGIHGGGKLDNPGNVGILLGNGNGTFQPVTNFLGGDKPVSIAVGDFNHDGHLDLAVANGIGSIPSNDITIFWGTGKGTFGTGTDLTTNGNPSQVVTADFNNNDFLDLAVPLGGPPGSLGILLSNKSGTFAGVVETAGGSTINSVAVGDFDGDRILDVAVTDSGENTAMIGLGTGTGVFTYQLSKRVGSGPVFIAVGDFNNDGKLDVAVANSLSGTVSVLLGRGTGEFQTAVDFITESGPSGVAVGDFNGDGLPDLAITNSGSNTVSILLNACGATTTTVTSSLNPSYFHQAVTFTATVSSASGGTPTGSVIWKDGGSQFGSGLLTAGVATVSPSNLSVGTHSITAVYSGDASFMTSISAPVSQVVNTNTTAAVTSSLNPSYFGQAVTFTVTVTSLTAGTPTGTVDWYDGAVPYGNGLLTGGVATVPGVNLAARTHSITAVYSGDALHTPSTSNVLLQVVNPNTTATVTSSLNPSHFGEAVTFTVTVSSASGGTPTGSVIWKDGGSQFGNGLLTGGVATVPGFNLAAATHSITADYSGDALHTPSTSNVLLQVVNANTTTTTVTSSLNPSYFHQAVTFTATVTSGSGGTPTGSVDWYDGAGQFGSGPLTAGVATVSPSNLSVATHSITAIYSGDALHPTSTSAPVSQVVNTNSTVTVTSSLNPSYLGQAVTFTATVTGLPSGTPTGTVDWFDGTSQFGSGPLTAGVATVGSPSLTIAGTHFITARYNGDATFRINTSPAVSQVVNANALATITSPIPGSGLTSSTVTFTWGAGTGATEYYLQVGKTLGGQELYSVSEGTNLSATVMALPTDGSTVYLRLWSNIGGLWSFNDYTYVSCTGCTATKAAMTTPAPGSTLSSSMTTFWWSVSQGSECYLQVGTTLGGQELYSAGQGTNLSVQVPALPTNGSPVYARLWTNIGGAWLYNDYTYTSCTSCTATKAVMTSPPSGSALTASSVTFTWSASLASQYYLQVGTVPGGQELYSAGQGTNLSTQVTGLPIGGGNTYVRLWSEVGGAWWYNDYSYVACSGCTPTLAAMTTPAAGATLNSTMVNFTWSSSLALECYLQVGTTPGGQEIYSAGEGTSLSSQVLDIPNNGSAVYVRLWSKIGGAWLFNDYSYTACTGCTVTKAAMVTPAPGSTLSSRAVTFTWGASLAAEYYLFVGTTAGGQEIYSAGQGTNLSVQVNDLPNNGTTVHARLWSRIGGAWLFNDHTYTACTGCQ